MFQDALAVIRQYPSFRYLLLGRIGSAAGTYIAEVALMIDIYDRTGSATWVGLLLVAFFLPSLLLPFIAGPLLDRWSRKRVMIFSDLTNLLVFCLIPFAGSPLQIVLLILPCGLVTGLFTSSVYAGLPNLVDNQHLPRANSLLQVVDNFSKILGPAAGGLLVASGGLHVAYLLNALSFALSALWISRVPATSLQQERSEDEGHWQAMRTGFRLLRHTPTVLTVAVIWSICIFGFAAMSVAEVAMAKTVLAGGDIGYGLLMTATGCGLLIGAFVAPSLIERLGLQRVYPAAIAVCSLALVVGSFSPTLSFMLACMVVMGFGNGLAIVSNGLLLQRGVTDQTRGRIIASVMGIGNSAFVLGFLVAGPFADSFGIRSSWLAAGAALAGAAALAVVRLSRNRDEAKEEEGEDGLQQPGPQLLTLEPALAPLALELD